MKTTRIVLTIPEDHGDAMRAEALRLGYNSPQNLLLAFLRGEVETARNDGAIQLMQPINIPPASPGRKKGKQ